LEALASLIKTQKLTGSKNEFYVPLCDALLDLVELDITGVRALKLSQIAHSLAHDFLNLAMLAGRLIWYEGVTPDMSRSPDLVAIAVDTENYLISLRTACDIVAEAFSYFCVEPKKRGQLPKEKQSFRAMICWAKNNPHRLRDDFLFITQHFEWFMELRALRDKIVHQGYYSNIYTDRSLFKFFLMPGFDPDLHRIRRFHRRHQDGNDPQQAGPRIRQVSLLSLLKSFTLSVFELTTQLSQAIEKQEELKCSKTHALSGVYVPALHHLLSYIEPIKKSEQNISEERQRRLAARYLLQVGDYLTSADCGYPHGFWWRFLMRLSELCTKFPRYISQPQFTGHRAGLAGQDTGLVEWNFIFNERDFNVAISLRDMVVLEEGWLKVARVNLDDFSRRAGADRAILVANRAMSSDKLSDPMNMDFLVVEADPMIAADRVFSALTQPSEDQLKPTSGANT